MISPGPALSRVVGTGGAVAIGLAAMIGAGVFTVWGPAAQAAGLFLLVGLAVAALVATANALSSAQLAVRYPEARGAYVYGRRLLGDRWGFVAGWSFVLGKTASCAVMALTVAAAVAPAEWQRPLGAGVALGVGLLASGGIVRTVRASVVAVVAVLVVLLVLVVSALVVLPPPAAPDIAVGADIATAFQLTTIAEPSVLGVLQAAGLLFFAFAGYARMATLGEEVRDPRRTLAKAIPMALAVVLVLYTAVGGILLARLGAEAVASSSAPVVDLARTVGSSPLEAAVTVAAAVAATGALLALFAGVGRTVLAMAREHDLPSPLARISDRSGAPATAQMTVAVIVVILVCVTDLRTVIGFSSFGVLVYYFIANLAALGQPRAERLVPRVLPVVGMLGTAVLAVTLPPVSVLGGLAVIAAGVLIRLVRPRLTRFL